jgi:peroxidase
MKFVFGSLVSHERRRTESILLRNHFFKSQTVYTPGNIDKYLIGLATQPHQKSDAIVTEEVELMKLF